ncbi:hypothetical protein D6833_11830, partial [Candidatus Parcubacteria bacterium]
MSHFNKPLLLARIGLQSPGEFVDRLEAALTSRLDRYLSNKADYEPISPEDALRKLLERLRGALETEDIEGFNEVEREMREKMDL